MRLKNILQTLGKYFPYLLIIGVVVLLSIFVYWSWGVGYISLDVKKLALGSIGKAQDVDTDRFASGRLLVSPYGVEEEFIEILTATKYRLFMWEYDIGADDVVMVMKNLSFLGVDVRVILENLMYGDESDSWYDFQQEIIGSDIAVQSDEHLGTNFNHTKTVVTDKQVVISTANLGYQGFWNNREYRLVSDDTAVVENLQELFLADWNGEKITDKDIHPAVVFCPINCRKVLDRLLGEATSSVQMQAQYLEDDIMIEQLLDLQEQGLRVELLLGQYQERSLLSGFSHVRIQHSPYLHAKNLLIDGSILLVTSMNFSTNAIENNREIGMLTDSQGAISDFVNQFYSDWNKAENEQDDGPP